MTEMEYREIIENNYFPILEKLSQDSINDLPYLKYTTDDTQRLFAATIYSSMLELSTNIYELIKDNKYFTVPILLRTLLEAHVDLINLTKDATYPDRLMASYLDQRKRLLKDANRYPEDPFFRKIIEMEDTVEKMESYDRDLKEKGIEPIIPGDKFHIAQLSDVKASVYWYLCQHSHNNINILEDRHVNIEDGKFSLVVFKDISDEDKIRYIDTLASIWLESTKIIHEFLDSQMSSRYSGLITSLKYSREKYEF